MKIFWRFWNDTVWSKVIASSINALLPIIGLLFYNHFFTENNSILDSKIEIWIILFFLFLGIIFYWIVSIFSFRYNPREREFDEKLYKLIREKLFSDDDAKFIREEGISGPGFTSEDFDFIEKIRDEKVKPDFKFFNPKIELAKNDFIESVFELENVMSGRIFNITHRSGYYAIPNEWDSHKYYDAQRLLSNSQKKLIKNYDVLIDLCRESLKI